MILTPQAEVEMNISPKGKNKTKQKAKKGGGVTTYD